MSDFDGAVLALLVEGDDTNTYDDGDEAPLHCTICFLGPADQLTPIQKQRCIDMAQRIGDDFAPFDAQVVSPAQFGDTPVRLIEHADLNSVRDEALADSTLSFLQGVNDEHPGYLPHVSGLDDRDTVRFDRAAAMLGGETFEFPLSGRAMTASSEPEVDDAYVLVRWMSELARPNPEAAVVASLEEVAEERGWHPYDALCALTAARGVTAAFDPDAHPHGHDGKFIEKFGIVKLLGGKSGGLRKKDLTGQRGEVTEIIPDPKTPGQPTIRVQLSDGKTVDVKPNLIEAAPEKARLDTPLGQRQSKGATDLGWDDLDREAQSGDPARADEARAEQQRRLDEYRAKSVDELNADLERLEGEGRDYRDEEAQAIVQIRNGKQERERQEVQSVEDAANPEAAAQRKAAGFEKSKQDLVGLAEAPQVRDAMEIHRKYSVGGDSKRRAVETAIVDLKAADDSNYTVRANALATALEGLQRDLRSQSGAPGSTIGIQSRHGTDFTSDNVKIQALSHAIDEVRRRAIIRASALTAASKWEGDLHPRGRDGQFIEKLGMVELFDVPGLEPGQRGKVTSIAPNKKTRGRPDILVQLLDPQTGKPGRKAINVKPDNLATAPEKGRLDPEGNLQAEKPGSLSQQDRGNFDEPRQRTDRLPQGEAARLRAKQQQLGGEARGTSDEELAAELPTAGPLWRTAIQKEQANRAARRAQDEARRQALIADVNAQAANLSTTDPEARAAGLDEILAKLRFSIIDTDKVHDHIYPPGESGRWSAERAAQHEQMWDDLLSQVEAAGIPQERDALVLGGLPGAGKSHMLKPGGKAAGFGVVSWEPNGELPEGTTHVSVNPDIVKEMLIARGMLPEGISQDLKPMEQVTFLHEESSYVAKMFSQRLGDLGYNVVLDNTMDSEGGMLKRMTPLAGQGYKFRGLFADIPQEESLASAKKRYLDAALTPQGGRFVPSSVQGNRQSSKGNMSKNRDAMDSLIEQDWFTEYMVVDNTGVAARQPKGDITVQGTGGGTAGAKYLRDTAPTAPAPEAAPAAPGAEPAAPAVPVV